MGMIFGPDEPICHKCGEPISRHGAYFEAPSPDATEGKFDMLTSGFYCPQVTD